jgi:hypothetical protein
MTPERHRLLEELCHNASERDPADRPAFLDDACADDQALRREVEELLAQAEEAVHFIETPALDVAAAALARARTPVGRKVGPYTVLSLLGSGGMGEVYRARDSLLHRDVAIKILPAFAGLDADRRARFEREDHLLAALNHPHIAAIYALEHVDGMHAREISAAPSIRSAAEFDSYFRTMGIDLGGNAVDTDAARQVGRIVEEEIRARKNTEADGTAQRTYLPPNFSKRL